MKTNLLNIPKTFSGEFTIKNPKQHRTQNNDKYHHFKIKVDLLPVSVIAWQNSCSGLSHLWHGQRVSIIGNWEQFNGVWQIHCCSLNVEKKYLKETKRARVLLRVIFSWLPDNHLKQFLLRVFNDTSIVDGFSSAPASRAHHHAFAGGLMVHSVDVAWRLFNQQQFPSRERYLGVVAALLHDIGKIKTLTKDMSRTRVGSVIDHELLTLEILSPHLRWLDEHDLEMAISLRSLLTWKPQNYDPIPTLDIYEALKAADRMSCGVSQIFNNNLTIQEKNNANL